MNRKIVTGAIGFFLLIFLIYQLSSSNSDVAHDDYLLKDNRSVSLKDIRETLKKADFNSGNMKDYFAGEVVNAYTLKYFKFMQMKFSKAATLEAHLEEVRKYLYESLPPEEAEKLFALYKKFVTYEDVLAKKMKAWMADPSSGSTLDILRKMHAYQKEVFGEDVAVKLFGPDIKAREYPLRRKHIISDDSLYGREKEERIEKLNDDMWGDDASSIEERVKPVDRYREKMDIYSKDLKEMNTEEKAEKIREFREELFTPDVIKRLEDVDALIEARKERETRYKLEEQTILNDPNLSDAEKKEKITALQNNIFGDDADAFRRREAISQKGK